MNFTGRKFTDLTTGNIVQVKDHFEDIAILDNNSKIRIGKLLDKSYYDEYIDPKSFFNNETLFNSFAQKIQQLPDDVVRNMKEDAPITPLANSVLNESNSMSPLFDEPAILQSDPELEKEELLRKYNIQSTNPLPQMQQQLERFQELLREEPIQPQFDYEEPVQRIEVQRDVVTPTEIIRPQEQTPQRYSEPIVEVKQDPIIEMFKNVKRNKEFKISIDIENKIPRPDFIEMMEDSYNTSIIDFLATEFTDEILKNPSIIKDKIIQEIKRIVYGEIESPIKTELPKIEDKVKEVMTEKKATKTRTSKRKTEI